MNSRLLTEIAGYLAGVGQGLGIVSLMIPLLNGCLPVAPRPTGSEALAIEATSGEFDSDLMTFSMTYAYPAGVLQGQPVTLYWHAPGADRVEVAGISGSWPGKNGSVIVYPQATQDYQLTAFNSKTTVYGYIHVDVLPYPGAVFTFWADPGSVTVGSPAYLRWTTQNCDYVEVRDDTNPAPIYTGRCYISDAVRVQPTVRTRYVITAYRNYSGPGTAGGNIATNMMPTVVGRGEAIVDIVDKVPEISLSTSTPIVKEGRQAFINWSVKDGDDIQFDPPIVSNPGAMGSASFVATKTTTYKLTAFSKINRQRVEQSVAVTVIPKFRIDSLKIKPEVLRKGDGTTLSWASTYCRRVWVTKIAGDRVTNDLSCNNYVDLRPTESTQYVVHFEYEDEVGEDLKIQDVPVSVSVVGAPEIAVPIVASNPPPSPQPVATPGPTPQPAQPTFTPQPTVVVPNPKEAPKIVVFNTNEYSTWNDRPIMVHWKAARAERVYLRAGGQTYTLPARGRKQILLKQSEKISLIAENAKYQTTPVEIEIKVTDRAMLDKLFGEMNKTK